MAMKRAVHNRSAAVIRKKSTSASASALCMATDPDNPIIRIWGKKDSSLMYSLIFPTFLTDRRLRVAISLPDILYSPRVYLGGLIARDFIFFLSLISFNRRSKVFFSTLFCKNNQISSFKGA